MKEIWKDIPNYNNYYQVSNYGRFRSLDRQIQGRWGITNLCGQILSLGIDKDGYQLATLSNQCQKTFRAHRIVAKIFISNKDNKPFINHIDGVKTNNRIDNLEWCTQSENEKHAFRIGLKSVKGEKSPSSKLTEDQVRKLYKQSWSGNYRQKELAQKYNISVRTVQRIKFQENWQHLDLRMKD